MIKGLCNTNAYRHEVTEITVIETHISWILLTGHFAYKIKKPVNFGFLDFSTLEKRRFYCSEELRLNRRFAPDIYLDVVPITGNPDHPAMDGNGQVFEYAVKMIQFPANLTLNELAATGKLGAGEIDQIADIVADFHRTIAIADEDSPYGNSDTIHKWFDENFEHIRPFLDEVQRLMQLQAIQDWGSNEAQKLQELMEQRKRQGYVRECHGDLHLGNITVIDGKVTLFDCIEFNPMLRWIDVISEVAFLVIDLLHSGYSSLGYRFLNRYLHVSGDYPGLALLRYYLVYRALVRAKVSLLRLEQQQNNPEASRHTSIDYGNYVDLAERFTAAIPAFMVITHGFSGSGKSTMSSQLAEKTGAIHIRSDIERKRLFGFRATDRTGSGIDEGLYTADAGQQTYRRLAELAGDIISAGFPAIVDAAFLQAEQRKNFRELADSLGAPFVIIDFRASDGILQQRISARQQENSDPSEATIDVLKHQQQSAEALTDSEFVNAIVVDTESNQALETLTKAFYGFSTFISE